MKTSLKKDVISVVGGLFRMNAAGAIGYLFNPNESETKISTGMFCHFESEINSREWTYFLDFKTGKYKTLRS